MDNSLSFAAEPVFQEVDGKIHGKLNASWKISSLAVNGQSFLVIDGYLLHFNYQLNPWDIHR